MESDFSGFWLSRLKGKAAELDLISVHPGLIKKTIRFQSEDVGNPIWCCQSQLDLCASLYLSPVILPSLPFHLQPVWLGDTANRKRKREGRLSVALCRDYATSLLLLLTWKSNFIKPRPPQIKQQYEMIPPSGSKFNHPVYMYRFNIDWCMIHCEGEAARSRDTFFSGTRSPSVCSVFTQTVLLKTRLTSWSVTARTPVEISWRMDTRARECARCTDTHQWENPAERLKRTCFQGQSSLSNDNISFCVIFPKLH